MRRVFEYCKFFFEFIRCSPHQLIFLLHPKKSIVSQDITRWLNILHKEYNPVAGLVYLLGFYPEFRNLFYNRIGVIGLVLNIICPKMATLYIVTKDIGPGLFIQHGFATIIAAKSIGKNCWINQQVTIGYGKDNDCPIISDDVYIKAGAKIFGSITIGSDTMVGANAVVAKNVPANCTVVGVPAYIVRLNGIKLKQDLI